MRKSSRGNPFHDEKGRFASKDKAAITIENAPEFYEERTERRKNVNTRNEAEVRETKERLSRGQTGTVNDKEHGRGPGNRDEGHRGTDVGTGDVLRKPGANVYPTTSKNTSKIVACNDAAYFDKRTEERLLADVLAKEPKITKEVQGIITKCCRKAPIFRRGDIRQYS